MTYKDLTVKERADYFDLDIESKNAPLERDAEGVLRFVPSRPIQFAASRISLNDMWLEAGRNRWPDADMRRFYRGMGYSLCGFSEIFG